MNIKITRDSVCAADDITAPHEYLIRNIESKDLSNILDEIKHNYLPQNVVNGSTWIITQLEENFGIIEYPSGVIKFYKSKEYKIVNHQIPLFAKCIGSLTIDQYEKKANGNDLTFISISDNLLFYNEHNEIKKVNLKECAKKWEEYVNNTPEFNNNNYISINCIGYVDSTANPMIIRIFGSKKLDFTFKTRFENIQQKLFRYRKNTYNKMNKVKKQISEAGFTLYDYS